MILKQKKSITDKIRKYNTNYHDVVKEAKSNRKKYSIDVKTINSNFIAYFIGLMLTDGYVVNSNKFGLQMTDKDVIEFIAKSTGNNYYEYKKDSNSLLAYRIVFSDSDQVKNLERYSVTQNKSYTIKGFDIRPDEKKYLPYLIRGIIDGDGCIHKTTKGSCSFYICSMSYDFVVWIKDILEKDFFMDDIHIRKDGTIWLVETSLQTNIFKLMAIVYNRPYGMARKYNSLRKMFRDYNRNNQQDYIWNNLFD